MGGNGKTGTSTGMCIEPTAEAGGSGRGDAAAVEVVVVGLVKSAGATVAGAFGK